MCFGNVNTPSLKDANSLVDYKKSHHVCKICGFCKFFMKKSAKILLKPTNMDKHAIKLETSKQLSYKPIYNLKPIELKTFKN